MKKIIIIMSVFAGVLFAGATKAQINISINIGSQPDWGPSGYNHVDYYYLPDINTYYNVTTAEYIYLTGNKWHFAKRLPNRFSSYNIYNAYKVVVNRPYPYQNNTYDIQHYGQYKNYHPQPMLRDNKAYKAMRNNGNHYGNNGNNHNTVVAKRTEKKVIKQTNRTVKQNGRTDKAVRSTPQRTTVQRTTVQRSR